MYLSELQLDPSVFRNPYEIHRVIWRLFPDQPDMERPFLYRIQRDHRDRPSRLLVLSNIEPIPKADRVSILRGPKPVEIPVQKGQWWRFALTANPTKRIAKTRARVPLGDDVQRTDWLRRQLASAAELAEAHVTATRTIVFTKGQTHGTVQQVDLTGLLVVKDVDQLHRLIQTGIGPAKAFGCGLLSLAPA